MQADSSAACLLTTRLLSFFLFVFAIHRRLLFFTAILLAGILSDTAPAVCSEIAPVQIDAAVLANDGTSLAGLKKEDFRVLDNGSEQPIVAFSQPGSPADAERALRRILDLRTGSAAHI